MNSMPEYSVPGTVRIISRSLTQNALEILLQAHVKTTGMLYTAEEQWSHAVLLAVPIHSLFFSSGVVSSKLQTEIVSKDHFLTRFAPTSLYSVRHRSPQIGADYGMYVISFPFASPLAATSCDSVFRPTLALILATTNSRNSNRNNLAPLFLPQP